LIWEFVSLAFQVISHGMITRLDIRVANLSDALHAGEAVRVSTFFTLIGGAIFRIPFCLGLFGALWLRRPKLRPLIAFLAVLIVAPLLGDLVKDVVRRPRPLAGQAALPGSFSFPSGHAVAASSAFSFLAYFAIRKVRRLSVQVAIALTAAVMIIGVAYSRVVLGFHFTSDVIAGTLLGLAVSAAAITWMDCRSWRKTEARRALPIFWPIASGVFAALVLAAALVRAVSSPHSAPLPAPLREVQLTEDSLNQAVLSRVPLFSETLTGRPMEPVGIVLAGSEQQIEAAFQSAGWEKADPVNAHSVLKLYAAAIDHRPYPNAPVTPSFLAGRPQDLAFEQDVNAGSVSKRHHIRIWRSGFELSDGTPIWVATTSLDDRVEIKFPNVLPNHHIDPAIDLERDYVASALEQTGLVSAETIGQAVPPQLGTNAAGDPFFTYGKAAMIDLRTP
jgi:undecaprenyl-diphosphatase